MNCINHPNRKAFSICQKYNHGYCRECCTCTDPKGYCKYRTRCIACPPGRHAEGGWCAWEFKLDK